ncbi:MAG: 50S ribosomal protein L18 [Candidatus Omnitrophica bacterium]|nr:50S ribosomal protein L18 [Candidatus Omnitrophota bacterium]MCM8809937.1 50S ribosomal protein L18 [Candidatus Omnitrophota bacterium]MCM8810666.1 50S ribosomal protein L18 [Candidatus Omnitrophota bacterium]
MKLTRSEKRKKRHLRVRKKIKGSSERPRLCVFRSHKHIYASLIDDSVIPNKVITTVSSLSPEFKKLASDKSINGGNLKGAELVGKLLAEKAKSLGIEKVVFDRGGYKYTGRVKILAESARKGGLKF